MISNIISLSYRLCVIYFPLTSLKSTQNIEKQYFNYKLNLSYHLSFSCNIKAFL